MAARFYTLNRETKETSISLSLTLEGESRVQADTGFGMADHMLTLLAFWAGFDLNLECRGDLQVDAHHTVEDVFYCLGQALFNALGDRKGIERTAFAKVPMDEALAEVCLDLSGRPYLVFNGATLLPPQIAGEERDLWREALRAFSTGAKMNLHVNLLYGENGHHLLESVFKGLGLALRQAVKISRNTISSSKGSLD